MSDYLARSLRAVSDIATKPRRLVLGVETSCDETACAVVENGRKILSSAVFSQIDLHKVYGGVVPEIASRAHIEKLDVVCAEALGDAGVSLDDIDAVAVTYGPGLVGALLTGVSYAKALAFGANKPLIPVNHVHAHICAGFLDSESLQPPFLALVVSGGHSHLVKVDEADGLHLMGSTVDDAAGEAFDKAARVMGLPYPGGPLLDALAEEGNDQAFSFTRPKVEGRYDLSFSGLKTAFINKVHQMNQRGEALPQADLAASYRKAVVDSLLAKLGLALEENNIKTLVLAGGVAANRLLRREVKALCDRMGVDCHLPPLSLCGDNAAMVAAAGDRLLRLGQVAGLDLNAQATVRLWEAGRPSAG